MQGGAIPILIEDITNLQGSTLSNGQVQITRCISTGLSSFMYEGLIRATMKHVVIKFCQNKDSYERELDVLVKIQNHVK